MSTPVTVGVDAGATLCKLVCLTAELETAVLPAGDVRRVREWIESWKPDRLMATGGGAAALGQRLADVAVERVAEFEAWARGAPLLAERMGLALPPCYLLVSLGTGTSVLAIREGRAERVGGTALGGGTLLGLARLLLDTPSFDAVARLAERGDRTDVDLLVGDIYPEGEAPLPAGLTAASFAKLASRRPEDLAHALVGLVGENIALLCGGLGRACGAAAIVYGGSTLMGNAALERVLSVTTVASGLPACFLAQGAFCGAVGAALLGAAR
ncbi:MAG: hypothetical protein ACE5FG_05295 [Myxococcota bacterium]